MKKKPSVSVWKRLFQGASVDAAGRSSWHHWFGWRRRMQRQALQRQGRRKHGARLQKQAGAAGLFSRLAVFRRSAPVADYRQHFLGEQVQGALADVIGRAPEADGGEAA